MITPTNAGWRESRSAEPDPDWRSRLAAAVAAVLAEPTYCHGSVATGQLDAASDLDLVVVVAQPQEWLDVARLDALGQRWTWQTHHSESEVVHRIVFADGRWLDLKFSPAGCELPEPHQLVPAGQLAGSIGGADPKHVDEQLDDQVRRARFVAALAAVKFVRDDQLIGGHLLLDLAALVLEQAMVHRDVLLGTDHHRHGGPLNQTWTQLAELIGTGSDTSAALLALAESELLQSQRTRSAACFEALARRLRGADTQPAQQSL